MAELLTRNLSVKAGATTLVEDANLRLVPGELVALLGPNGAGKTSLLKAALGLEKRSAGDATLDGSDSGKLSPIERARRVAYLPQQAPTGLAQHGPRCRSPSGATPMAPHRAG